MCYLCLWGLGYSHGLASREIFQVSMRGWHQVFMIMVDKVKFKITIPKEYMLVACGWSHDGQVKTNTKQSFPHCVWESYLKTSPMSCLSHEPRRNINIKLNLKWKARVKGISSFDVSVVVLYNRTWRFSIASKWAQDHQNRSPDVKVMHVVLLGRL